MKPTETRNNEVVQGDKVTYKIKRRLTLPLVSLAHVEQIGCRITGPIETKHMEGFGKGPDGGIDVVPAVTLPGGEPFLLVASAVIASSLRAYGDYVGKCFLFRQGKKVEGKRYRPVDVYEIEE